MGERDYFSSKVETVLYNLPTFVYEDQVSEKMLVDLDQQTWKREDVVVADRAIYNGTWSGKQRHGRGKQVWPDGQRYDGYWAVNE